MKKIGVVSALLFFLLSAVVYPAFAQGKGEAAATQGAGIRMTVLEPVKVSLAKLGGYLPKLGGLLLILVIGALIAVGIATLVGHLLVFLRLEKGAKKIKIPQVLKNGGIKLSLSELCTEIVFFLIIIGTLITALEFYGLGTSALTGQILSYIPNVIAAVFILILGILLAIFIAGIIGLVGGNVRIAQTETLGNIARYAIIVFSGLVALKVLGLGVILTDSAKDIILGGLVLGFALAFGLGAKDKAGKFLDGIFKK